MDDEFKVVVRPKRRHKFSKSKHSQQTQQVNPTDFERQTTTQSPESSLESVRNILEECSEEIMLTSFYETFKDILLVKMHDGSRCGLHRSSLASTVQSDASKPTSIVDSAADPSKASSIDSNEENSSDLSKQNPSANTDLQIQETDECLKMVSLRIENPEPSSFPFLSDKTVSSRLHPQDGIVEDVDRCNELTSLELVVYGIGHFAECLIARYQFALMLALRNTLKLPPARLLVFDPMLSDIEKSVIKELGLSLISHNEEGKRHGTGRHWTLFFMPHCGKALCNNLLWANWSPDQLSNIIIIGNSFSSIIERSPERLLRQYYYYIWKIHSITDETSLPNSFKHSDVFNDTSIHCFRSVDLSQLPKNFWLDNTEPVYDSSDLEIIVNK